MFLLAQLIEKVLFYCEAVYLIIRDSLISVLFREGQMANPYISIEQGRSSFQLFICYVSPRNVVNK